MKTYQQIQKEIVALEQQAEKAKTKEIAGVVASIKEAIKFYGLTAQDLGLGGVRSPAAKTGRAAPAKRRGLPAEAKQPRYRNEVGNVWGGRGPRPAWLRTALATGKVLEDFAVT